MVKTYAIIFLLFFCLTAGFVCGIYTKNKDLCEQDKEYYEDIIDQAYLTGYESGQVSCID